MKEELLMSVRSFQTPTKLLRLLGCFPALRQPLFQYFLDWTQIQNIHGCRVSRHWIVTPHSSQQVESMVGFLRRVEYVFATLSAHHNHHVSKAVELTKSGQY